MHLNIILDEQNIPIKVPPFVMESGEEFFARMDADMDKGWQIARHWVDRPNTVQRCQIIADRILGAIENNNEKLAMMMAGYILSRAPGVKTVHIATDGEIQETELI